MDKRNTKWPDKKGNCDPTSFSRNVQNIYLPIQSIFNIAVAKLDPLLRLNLRDELGKHL
jgi:hypothetical protein